MTETDPRELLAQILALDPRRLEEVAGPIAGPLANALDVALKENDRLRNEIGDLLVSVGISGPLVSQAKVDARLRKILLGDGRANKSN